MLPTRFCEEDFTVLRPSETRGPFHKKICAGVNTPAGLRFALGMKLSPARREKNV